MSEECSLCNVVTYCDTDLELHIKTRHESRLQNGEKKIITVNDSEFEVFIVRDDYFACTNCAMHGHLSSIKDHIYNKHILTQQEKLERRKELKRERVKNLLTCGNKKCKQRFRSEKTLNDHKKQGCKKYRESLPLEDRLYYYTLRRLHRESKIKAQMERDSYVNGTGCDICRRKLINEYNSRFKTRERTQYNTILWEQIEKHYNQIHPTLELPPKPMVPPCTQKSARK